MDKLTQFVSKSFESNAEPCRMKADTLKSEEPGESEPKQERRVPVPKNWLIPDSPKQPQNFGMDLRLNNPDIIYASSLIVNQNRANGSPLNKVKWFEDNVEVKPSSPKNSYSSSSSSIDLEDSKSCTETLSEKTEDPAAPPPKDSEDDKKLCK